MADKLKVTLVKSPIGAIPKHRRTVENFQTMMQRREWLLRFVI